MIHIVCFTTPIIIMMAFVFLRNLQENCEFDHFIPLTLGLSVVREGFHIATYKYGVTVYSTSVARAV